MSYHSPHLAPDPDALAVTCNLTYVRRRLGKVQGWGDMRTCSYVQALVEQRQFPAPFPEFRRKRDGDRTLTDQVLPNSTWQRYAVDCWFGDYLPPDAEAALDAAQLAAAAAQMDANAGNLRLVGGRG